MSQQKLLKKVVEALNTAGIDYMVTGSTASSLYGEPRATHDIDIVIAIKESAVKKLVGTFQPPKYYLDETSIREAIHKKDMFNLIDTQEGDKVDFWILKEDAFDHSRFGRKKTEEVLGIKMRVSSPEDMILVKLKWAKLSGGSEKQLTDALRIYEVQFKKLDIKYLESWVKKLELESLWKELKVKAKII